MEILTSRSVSSSTASDSGFKKIKLYTHVTPSHEQLLNDIFLPSATEFDVVVCRGEQKSSGVYGTENWHESMFDKLKSIHKMVEENKGDIVVWSDVDVVFLQPFSWKVESLLGNSDIAFQYTPKTEGEMGASAGFFVARCNERVQNFFASALHDQEYWNSNDERIGDQACLNRHLHRITWKQLPSSFWTLGYALKDGVAGVQRVKQIIWDKRKNWQEELRKELPGTVHVFHANYAALHEKAELLHAVQTAVNVNPEFSLEEYIQLFCDLECPATVTHLFQQNIDDIGDTQLLKTYCLSLAQLGDTDRLSTIVRMILESGGTFDVVKEIVLALLRYHGPSLARRFLVQNQQTFELFFENKSWIPRLLYRVDHHKSLEEYFASVLHDDAYHKISIDPMKRPTTLLFQDFDIEHLSHSRCCKFEERDIEQVNVAADPQTVIALEDQIDAPLLSNNHLHQPIWKQIPQEMYTMTHVQLSDAMQMPVSLDGWYVPELIPDFHALHSFRECYVRTPQKTRPIAFFLPGFFENHYHLLIDGLSPLLLYKELHLDCPVVIPIPRSHPDVAQAIEPIIRACGIPPGRILCLDDVRDVVFDIGILAHKRVDVRTSEFYREIVTPFMASVDTQLSGDFSRVYLSRSQTPRRSLQNEKEIETLLTQRGFQICHMHEYSLADQVRIMQQARYIIAPHGAAMTNLFFCKPGTTVLELQSRGMISPLFKQIATLSDLEYFVLFGDEVHQHHTDEFDYEWTTDIDRLQNTLDTKLSREYLTSGRS